MGRWNCGISLPHIRWMWEASLYMLQGFGASLDVYQTGQGVLYSRGLLGLLSLSYIRKGPMVMAQWCKWILRYVPLYVITRALGCFH